MERNIIYQKRKELGYTLEAVGKLVGVSKNTVRKWEVGIIENIRRDNIEKLSKVLGISPVELLGIEEPEQNSQVASENLLLENFCSLNLQGKTRVLAYIDCLKNIEQFKK